MLRDLAASTARSLRAHALRFTLTSLGITWGTLMLSYLSATMAGIDAHYQRQLLNVGPRMVYVFPGVILKERVGERGARPIEFENDDIRHVGGLEIVERAAPNLWLGSRVMRAEHHTKLLWAFGVSEETLRVRNFHAEHGRLITPTDVQRGARVVFLGHRAKSRLFGRAPVLGRTLHIDSIPFRIIGVAQEGQHSVSDQIRRRLVTRDEEQPAHLDDLFGAEPVTLFLRDDECADQVCAGLGAPLRRDLFEVPLELARRFLGPQRLARRREAEREHEFVGPMLQPITVLDRHAKDLCDDHDGQRGGKIADHVHLAARLDEVQVFVDDGFDTGLKSADGRQGKCAADQPSQTIVIRGVGAEHRSRQLGVHLGPPCAHLLFEHLLVVATASLVHREARVLEDLILIRIAGEHPTSAQMAAVHRVPTAQTREERIGIAHVTRIVGVVDNSGAQPIVARE